MKHEFIIEKKSPSVVILFAGWGMTADPFREYATGSCDMIIVYDYNDFQFDTSILASYSNIYIFAWSFGVFAASYFIYTNPTLPICFRMAINGTPSPIHNEKGIPEKIFSGTLNTLSEATLLKFYRRMCDSSEQYHNFIEHRPQREIDSLRSELINVEKESKTYNFDSIKWDKVIIGSDDRIFPMQNQINAWSSICENVTVTQYAHLPANIIKLITDNIINKSLLKRRFSKNLLQYNSLAVCQQEISRTLHDLWLSTDYRKKSSILEVGCGTGFLTNLYINSIYPSRLVLNDLCAVPKDFLSFDIPYSFIQGDAEIQTFNGGGDFDYIVSSSAIQWFENLPKFIQKCSSILNENGMIVFSTFGKENMNEIAEVTSISLIYHNNERLREIIEPYFDIIVMQNGKETLYFDSPIDVLRHIKSTGVNSIRQENKWTKSDLDRFSNEYICTNGKYPLTYNPIYIIARKK